MNINDITVGQKVRSVDEPEPGTVREIDHDDHMVYVEFAIPGPGNRSDVVDVDPGDLEPA